MRKLLLSLALYLLILSCGSKEKMNYVCDEIYTSTLEAPIIIDGISDLQKKIAYPEDAIANAIEGQVKVAFVVNKRGKVQEARIVNGLGHGIDAEALRIINTAKFKPASQTENGPPVCSRFALTINFRIPD